MSAGGQFEVGMPLLRVIDPVSGAVLHEVRPELVVLNEDETNGHDHANAGQGPLPGR